MASRSSSRLSMLRRIRDIASEIQPRWPYSQALRPRPAAPQTPLALDLSAILPNPCSLVPELEASGVDPGTAQRISIAYTAAASRLKGRCESLLQKCCQNLEDRHPSNSLSLLEQTISRQYHSALRRWKENALQMTHSIACTPTGKNRPAFKQNCIPLLERYWDYNAYPSPADRTILADKTGLTHRQIEVWFQNHRNRAKKTGRPRTRLNCGPNAEEFIWKEVEEALSVSTDQSDEGSPETITTISTPSPAPVPESVHPSGLPLSSHPHFEQTTQPLSRPTPRSSILDTVQPPAHAFPAPFSFSESSPSDHRNSSGLKQVEWYRHPTSTLVKRPVSSIEDLCDSFQLCLNLRRRCHNTENKTTNEMHPLRWSPPTYVTPHSTHHPALLKRKRPSSTRSKRAAPLKLLPLPHRPCRPRTDGFLRYRRQPSTFVESLVTNQRLQSSQLRRRSSSSSVESSVGCSTPVSSPPVPSVRLQTDEYETLYFNQPLEDCQGETLYNSTPVLFCSYS